MNGIFVQPLFKFDYLSAPIAVAIGVFFIFTLIYSLAYMRQKKAGPLYYLYIILTAAVSVAAVASNNLIMLLVFWGFLGLLLYLLINFGDEEAPKAAKKAMVIVGGTDAMMVLGVALIYYLGSSFQFDSARLAMDNGLAALAYVCIAIGCFAKAGAMPFHSWIPDCAQSAPIPVTAYLPASLDKLLGIYLLIRCIGIFEMNTAANVFLVIVGMVTIVAAVMMALVQHNLKRLLGYHAVSQVGYMVLGIGTGNPIGIAGGLFHMLNHALYKSCLFFTAGNVEQRTRSLELDKLGGLAKRMPLTYASAVISSFSISGIPPLNGFFSKWMIYQGIIYCLIKNSGKPLNFVYIFAILAAMFGSVLTLASFMKMLHAVFLGQRLDSGCENIKEVSWLMWLPCVFFSLTCVLFGVFAFSLPLKHFIFPAVSLYQPVSEQGLFGRWSPVLATCLMLAGLVLGMLFFYLGNLKKLLRRDSSFTGGEWEQLEGSDIVSGTEFYNSIKEYGALSTVYKLAQKGTFDIYAQAKKIFIFSKGLIFLHNGILPTYLVWMLLGMIGLFAFLTL